MRMAAAGQMGVPGQMASYGPAMNQTGQRRNFKPKKICTFFLDNRCTKGDACTFAHSVDSLHPEADLSQSFDWDCPSCGDRQFARNDVCRKCGEPKASDAPIHHGQQEIANIAQEGLMMNNTGQQGASNPITAVCTVHNKSRSIQNLMSDESGNICCAPGFECQTAAPMSGGGMTFAAAAAGGCGGSAQRTFQEQGPRQRTFQEGPRPSAQAMASASAGIIAAVMARNANQVGALNPCAPAVGGKSGGKMQAGDWTCPGCQDHQFARNSQCRRCNTPKPLDAMGGKGDTRFSPY